MGATYAGDAIRSAGDGGFRAHYPPAIESAIRVEPVLLPRALPAISAGPNWIAIVTIVAVHMLLLVALVKLDVIDIGRKAPPPPIVVDLLADQPPPPPPAALEPEVAPVKPIQPVVVAPPPIVQTPTPPPAIAVVAEAPPPQAVVVAPAPKAAVVAAPVSVDLSTKLIAGAPPKYPTDSRRKKEQGTVTLRVLVGLDGNVAEIGVARSSGFDRLDQAALMAVRRWRWSPTIQAGAAVQVRGVVEIPFVLQG